MFKNKEPKSLRYKVFLIAYKDLSKEKEKELTYHFISIIRNREDIEDVISGCDKNSSGLSFRTCMYHRWFRSKMEEKLDEGYRLGMVEVAKSYGDADVKKLKELDDKFGDNILVVASEEL